MSVTIPDLEQPDENIKKPSEHEEKPKEIHDLQPSENKDHGKRRLFATFFTKLKALCLNSSILSTQTPIAENSVNIEEIFHNSDKI